MKTFTLDEIILQIPRRQLTARLIEVLDSGRYERSELRALKLHAQPTDRVLDIGAGAGYLCCQAAKIVGPQNVFGIEANPVMAKAAQANLSKNFVTDANILSGAAVPDRYKSKTIKFNTMFAFWAGHVDAELADDHPRMVNVKAIPIGKVMAFSNPSIVSIDIEGYEIKFADYDWPASVRLIIVEIHPKKYSSLDMNRIFLGMFGSGFSYCASGSRGQTLVFIR